MLSFGDRQVGEYCMNNELDLCVHIKSVCAVYKACLDLSTTMII